MGSEGRAAMGYDHGYDAEVFYLGFALDEKYIQGFVEGCPESIGDNSEGEMFLRAEWEEGLRRWCSRSSMPSARSVQVLALDLLTAPVRAAGPDVLLLGRWHSLPVPKPLPVSTPLPPAERRTRQVGFRL